MVKKEQDTGTRSHTSQRHSHFLIHLPVSNLPNHVLENSSPWHTMAVHVDGNPVVPLGQKNYS